MPWLATAHRSGPSLGQAVAEHGPLPPLTVFRLVAGVAEGLAAVHACGIIHRDLEPANVLLAKDGPRVIDFGIAHASDATSLTGTGLSVGTQGAMFIGGEFPGSGHCPGVLDNDGCRAMVAGEMSSWITCCTFISVRLRCHRCALAARVPRTPGRRGDYSVAAGAGR